jgi:D-glycero-D-manno-heptose 1,7-bisphosphate phosphatase
VKAVFLDRDGVINENRATHVKSWSEFRFIPGAREAIARISQTGYRAFVITNQAIINRGLATHEEINAINQRMIDEIQRHGGRIDAVAYCPHRSDEDCGCRKPKPGLLFSLSAQFGIDLAGSVVIGDAISDVEAGRAAGCKAILVLTGRGDEQLKLASTTHRATFRVAPDLGAAVRLLLDSEKVEDAIGRQKEVESKLVLDRNRPN